MNDLLIVAALSAGSALFATLLTIFLTPRLQHRFWKYQRRTELRLQEIDEINKLMAEFIENYIEAEIKGETCKPSIEFFRSLQAAAAKVKALFSDQTFNIFKKMEVMIGPKLGPSSKQRTVDDFIQARDVTLKALYEEVGIVPPKLSFCRMVLQTYVPFVTPKSLSQRKR